ncbi:hypothetical protein JD844_019018, partial [Phrynosoma platyrhinos]
FPFQGLVNEEIKNVSTLLNILQKHGRNINMLGDVGFPAMIEYGLVQKISKIQILENFIWRACTLAADKRINIYIQQEAVRKLNTMLDAMPRDTRKKIISTKEMLHAM